MSTTTDRPAAKQARSLSGLAPFLRPYRGRIALALITLLLAALATLAFPIALRGLIDAGFAAGNAGERLMALREHFLAMFAVGAALGLFSASRFYMVTWLGERVTADLRNAVYTHVLRQSPSSSRRRRPARCSPESPLTPPSCRPSSAPVSRWACATSSWVSALWSCSSSPIPM